MVTHRLAAIMFTDIVGYTAMMQGDREQAMRAIKLHEATLGERIAAHGGELLQTYGDGSLSIFDSASAAVQCAREIQDQVRELVPLRIGLHIGEITRDGDHTFGDGVNIASRIESMGQIGTVLCSKNIYEKIRNRPEFQMQSLGQVEFKNVSEPMEVFALANAGFPVPRIDSLTGKFKEKQALEKSIAVLPFVNMSNDPENEYFCDGLSEELLNVLAQIEGLKVAARTSSFMFKALAADIQEIGQKLKVSTVLEGSVRKAGNRLRITAQLVNAADGYHLWSERYDRQLEDIFDIQDEISLAILDALKVQLLGEEKAAVVKRYTNNSAAYQLYLQGRFHYHKWTGEGYMKAVEYYQQAIEMEPDYALAYAGLSETYQNLWFFQFLPPEESLPKMKKAALRAIALDDGIAESHVAMARMKFNYDWDFSGAEAELEKAIQLNPNFTDAHEQYAVLLATKLGKRDEALFHAKKALELNPFSPMTNLNVGYVYFHARDLELLQEQGQKLIEFDPDFFGGYFLLGMYHLLSENYEQAIPHCQLATRQYPVALSWALLGSVFGVMGERDKAQEILQKLEDMSAEQPVGGVDRALVYAGMGDFDLAFDWLEHAYLHREGILAFFENIFNIFPGFEADPRLAALVKKVALRKKRHKSS